MATYDSSSLSSQSSQNSLAQRLKQYQQNNFQNDQLKSSLSSMTQGRQLILEDFGLTDLVDDLDSHGEVVRLAYIGINKEAHIDEQALYLLQKYSSYEVAFVSILGQPQSQKSFLLDTILNLSSFHGNHFSSSQQQSEPALYLWSIPFTKNDKLKLFLLDSSEFLSSQASRQQEILIDLMMILSSSIIITHPWEEKLKKKYAIFQKDNPNTQTPNINLAECFQASMARLLENEGITTKQSLYWPHSVYYAPRNNSLSESIDQIFQIKNQVILKAPFSKSNLNIFDEMFTFLNQEFSKVDKTYLSSVSSMFRDIVQSTINKQYMGLKYTGNICCKLLINSIRYMNRKSKIKINKMFHSMLKELYSSALTFHRDFYDDVLKDYFLSEQPYPLDYLISAFKVATDQTLQSFNHLTINQLMHDEFEQQLLRYIDEKERLILAINKKKTKTAIYQNLVKISVPKGFQPTQFQQFLLQLNQLENQYDHDQCEVISVKLFQFSTYIEKKYLEEKEEMERQFLKKLSLGLADQRAKLDGIKQVHREITLINEENKHQEQRLLQNENSLQQKAKTCRKEIEVEKKYQREYLINKESKKEHAESLLDFIRQLEEKHRENDKIVDQIQKQSQYHPKILELTKKVEEKKRITKQIQKKLEGNQEENQENLSVLVKKQEIRF